MEVIYSPAAGVGVVQGDEGYDIERQSSTFVTGSHANAKSALVEIELGDVDSTQQQTESKEKDPKGRKELSTIKEVTFLEILTAILALAAFATSLWAIITIGFSTSTSLNPVTHLETNLVKAASILIFLLSPYSYFQQRRITDIKALKETGEALTNEVDLLAKENDNLKETVTRLGQSVTRMEELEDVMAAIFETEGQSISSLQQTVATNRESVAQLEKNVRASILQNILEVVFASDTNRDYRLSDKEMKVLVQNLRDVNGVTVDEGKFREIVEENNGSVEGVVAILKDLVNEDVEHSIFTFEGPSR